MSNAVKMPKHEGIKGDEFKCTWFIEFWMPFASKEENFLFFCYYLWKWPRSMLSSLFSAEFSKGGIILSSVIQTSLICGLIFFLTPLYFSRANAVLEWSLNKTTSDPLEHRVQDDESSYYFFPVIKEPFVFSTSSDISLFKKSVYWLNCNKNTPYWRTFIFLLNIIFCMKSFRDIYIYINICEKAV